MQSYQINTEKFNSDPKNVKKWPTIKATNILMRKYYKNKSYGVNCLWILMKIVESKLD